MSLTVLFSMYKLSNYYDIQACQYQNISSNIALLLNIKHWTPMWLPMYNTDQGSQNITNVKPFKFINKNTFKITITTFLILKMKRKETNRIVSQFCIKITPNLPTVQRVVGTVHTKFEGTSHASDDNHWLRLTVLLELRRKCILLEFQLKYFKY